MTFADLVTGAAVFVDATTLIQLFEPHPNYGTHCQQLTQRIDNQELIGVTSTHVVGEACHRLMTVEAHRALGWAIAGIGNRLRTNPLEVRKLSLFRRTSTGCSSTSRSRAPMQGRKEGLLEGIAQDLDVKFGQRGRRLLPRVRALEEVAALRTLSRKLKTATTLDEVRALLPREPKAKNGAT
jgi:hypothetical protein